MARTPARKTVRRAPVRKPVRKPPAKRAPVKKPPAKRTSGRTASPKTASTRWRAVRALSLPGGTSRCTGLVVDAQQQTQWCWAAVSNSVAHFYDPSSPWTQCAVVNAEMSQTACCTDGSSAACNQPWYLDLALMRVGCLQSVSAGTLPFATVRSLLNVDTPPCARQVWAGGGAHFVAIVCCFRYQSGLMSGTTSAAPTSDRLQISDPWYGDSIVDYATFVSGYMGTGTWTHSYLTQA